MATFSLKNQKCQLEECVNGPQEHQMDASCMEDLNEELFSEPGVVSQEDLDNPHFLKASSQFYGGDNLKSQIDDMLNQDSEEEDIEQEQESSSSNTPDLPHTSTRREGGLEKDKDINQAINNFYRYWISPEHQEILYKTPFAVFDYIMRSPHFESYKDMYGKCRLKFHQLGSDRGRDLMLHFISEGNIRYFQNFDIIMFGASVIHQTANQKDLEQLTVEFESKVSFLVDSVKTVEEHIRMIDSSHETLRDTINCVSEAAHGLKSAKRSLELQHEKNPQHFPDYPHTSVSFASVQTPTLKPKTVYKKEHLAIPLGKSNELMYPLVPLYNKGLTSSDLIVFEGLSKMKEEALFRALNVPWSILLKWASLAKDSSPMSIARMLVASVMSTIPLPEKIRI